MPPKIHKEVVGDLNVITTELHPFAACEVFPELFAALAAGLSGIKGMKFDGKEGFTLDDLPVLAPAMASIGSALSMGKLKSIIPTLLSKTIVSGPGADGKTKKWDLSEGWSAIDEAFHGRLLELGKVVTIAVRITFADFSSVAGLFGAGKATASDSEV